MSKSIVIKSGIVLVVLGVIHSVFWFFKTGQLEKQVNNFITENSTHVSAGEIAISGFPLKQTILIKDLKFSIPNPAFSKYQTTVKNLEATSGIFGNNFTIAIIDQVSVQDNETNISGLVEFGKEAEISAVLSDGMISKFSYQDFGHRVLDVEKNVIYASSGANISIESSLEDGDKIKTKIIADLKDIEGFDILSVYKNSSEKKVIEGIKTGEITIGNSASLTPASASDVAAANTPTPTAAPAIQAPNTEVSANPMDPDSAAKQTEDMTAAVANNLVKSNFILDAEYVLTPTQSGSEQQTQTDPTQIQETPVQYSKTFKIANLEFSNPLYKITVNGQIDIFQDDALPSGSVTVKVEKVDNLVSHISAGLTQAAEQKKPSADSLVQSAELAVANDTNVAAAPTPSQDTASATATNSDSASAISATTPAVDDSYQIFLKRFVASLASVTKEVSSKNQLSKDDLSVFDIRREKNLELLINETPTREILGKF